MTRLHHEQIARPAGVARWLLMTHGIYGAGNNWRGIAKKLIERRPDWGIVLVDLRQHGRSDPGEPPHTIAACARDLHTFVAGAGLTIDALAGHSFGGKVVLAARSLIEPVQTWVLDASPSARPEAIADPANRAVRVLELMERLPRTWARREDFIAAITAEGHASAFAQWLAMNVVPEGGVFALRLDLVAMRALLVDYYAVDLWSELLERPGDVEYVVATRSNTVSDDDRTRLAAAPPHVHVHHIDADHWLNIDAPAAVIDLIARRLP